MLTYIFPFPSGGVKLRWGMVTPAAQEVVFHFLYFCQLQASVILIQNIVCYNKDKQFVVIRYKYDNKYLNEKLNVYEFIARIVQHIDGQTIHTRYYGVYSNTLRHKWRKDGRKPNIKSKGIDKKDYKKKWAELIWQIYEVDPLVCINCGARMKLKFLVDKNDARLQLEKIKKLKHYFLGLGRWSFHPPPQMYAA